MLIICFRADISLTYALLKPLCKSISSTTQSVNVMRNTLHTKCMGCSMIHALAIPFLLSYNLCMKLTRASGILLHPASLPGTPGIGTIGKNAFAFADFLSAAGCSLWQTLPLGPTGYGDSPYQSFSTFAGNPYFIDLDQLINEGLLSQEECDSYDWGSNKQYIDYEKIYLSRFKVLRIAYKNSNISHNEEFNAYCNENNWWLEDYALYMAIKDF